MNPETTQLDQDVVNLAKAIRQHESGGDPRRLGGSGEHGAYQFTGSTWQKYASEAGLNVPLEQATLQQQNEVAYKKIKQWKDAGYNVGQVASMWNAGEGRPDAYAQNWRGTNERGVQYDTPAYAEKVAATYKQMKQGGATFNPRPYSQPDSGQPQPQQNQNPESQEPQEPGLGAQLVGRTNDLSKSVSDTFAGNINPISGALQAGGALAGAVNDITTKGLELIPGFKKLEGLIGKGVGKLAETEAGQAVAKSIQEFSTAHPELSADIGAGFNIVTAIPILKGLGVLKNIAMDATASALKGVAEKSFAKELTEVAGRTVGGRKILAEVPEAIDGMVSTRALPEIVEGRYVTRNAYEALEKQITSIEEGELQAALSKASTPGIDSRLPLAEYRKIALQQAESELKDPSGINSLFDRIQQKYGDFPTLQQMNEAKRSVARNISEAGFNSPTYTTDKIVRKSLQTGIEEGAEKLGLGDVKAINQKMSKLIKAQKLLKALEGKSIKSRGLVHEIVQGAATIGGEAAGHSVGIPIAGAIVGRRTGGLVERALSGVTPRGLVQNALTRTAPDAVRQTVRGTSRKVGGLFGAAMANREARR